MGNRREGVFALSSALLGIGVGLVVGFAMSADWVEPAGTCNLIHRSGALVGLAIGTVTGGIVGRHATTLIPTTANAP